MPNPLRHILGGGRTRGVVGASFPTVLGEGWIYKWCPTAVSHPDNTTLADDPVLFVDLPASSFWEMEFNVWMQWDADSDMKCRLAATNAPTRVICERFIAEQTAAATTLVAHNAFIAFPFANDTLASTANNSIGLWRAHLMIQPNAATRISFQFAKNSAPGTGEATRFLGSYVRWRPIPR